MLLLILALALDLVCGPAALTLGEVFTTLLYPAEADDGHYTIVWNLRMPVAIMATLVGATLGIAGAEMQTLLNNPLASPYTLGVSSGASFGAAFAMVFCTSMNSAIPLAAGILVPLNAFAFALLGSLVILWVGKIKGGAVEAIVLCGVALLFLFHSGVAAIQYLASEDTLQAIVFWIFGSVQSASWPRIALLAGVLVVAIPVLLSQSWKLTAFRLGELHARSLGVDVRRLRLLMLMLVSVLTATAVCFSGAIGFVGLVAPHIARLTVGEDHRFFLPLSALVGGVILSLASTASKTVLPGAVLPLGIVTSLIGVPFFFTMVMMQRRHYW